MTQDELMKKVIDVENAVKKRESILEKNCSKKQKLILKSADSYDISCIDSDIKDCQSKLKDAQVILSNWKEKYNKRISEDEYIQANCPEVINVFLEQWKQNAISWYLDRYIKFIEFKKELRSEEYKARRECVNLTPEYEKYKNMLTGDEKHDDYILLNVWPRKIMEEYLSEKDLNYNQVKKRITNFGDHTLFKMCELNEVTHKEWLEKVMEVEKRAKMLDLMRRICEYIGTITDASNLKISPKGDINGILIGTEGRALIETIGAGGYNVQCFHFRTLIHHI